MDKLENLLSQATNATSEKFDSETVKKISELIDSQPFGPALALRSLAHKVQSPHEREALHSLSLLEALAKQCGPTFRSELGKFKFLNELIKVLSPKYLADHISENVKKKCIQLLHDWQRDFSANEPKFTDVYNLLIREGIINPDQWTTNGTTPQGDRNSLKNKQNIFEHNKKTERLTQLLRSRNPADVHEANALIKSIVEEDQVRMEKISQRSSEMEALRNSTILLEEMIGTFILGESTNAEISLMTELVESIRQARPALYRFSLTHEERDMETLNEIGIICDRASNAVANFETKVLKPNSHKSVVDNNNNTINKSNENLTDLFSQDLMNLGLNEPILPLPTTTSATTNNITSTTDLLCLDMNLDSISNTAINSWKTINPITNHEHKTTSQTINKYNDLADIFANLNKENKSVNSSGVPINIPVIKSSVCKNLPGSSNNSVLQPQQIPITSSPFSELDSLGRQMLGLSKINEPKSTTTIDHSQKDVISSNNNLPDSHQSQIIESSHVCVTNSTDSTNQIVDTCDLTKLDLKLSDIKPHSTYTEPFIIYPIRVVTNHKNDNPDSNDIDCLVVESSPNVDSTFSHKIQLALHYASNKPDPNVNVFVAVVTSQNILPINEINIRFGVEKPFRIRQLIASGQTLPAYSSFLPPSSISQIVLLYNPSNFNKFNLKFQLSFVLDNDSILESGKLELPCD